MIRVVVVDDHEIVRRGLARSIARRLGISVRTGQAHVTRILQRIGVSDRAQIAPWAERNLREACVPGGDL